MTSRFSISCLLALLFAAPAHAQQGFALDRFALAPTPEDGLALQLPSTLGHLRWSARLSLGYANEPLVSGSPTGRDVVIVSDHVAAQAAFALGLGERFEVSALLPVTLYQSGDDSSGSGLKFREPNSTGVGDLALGGSAHLLGDRDRGFSLGLNAALLLPIGSPDALASDGELGARGTLSAALAFEPVTFAIEGGAAYRPKRKLGFIDSGSELLMRAGAYIHAAERFRVLVEANAATRLASGMTFKELSTPLEALLGADYALRSGLRLGLAGGPGFTLATGTPAFRVFATLGYAGPREAPAPLETSAPVVVAEDRDVDGILDANDRCPNEAEDRDGFEDSDGCPDADPLPAPPPPPPPPPAAAPVEPPPPAPVAAPEPVPAPKPEVVLPDALKFGKKSAALSPASTKKLQALVEAMRANTDQRLALEGHSSGDGDAEFNQKLSEQRAEAVKAWLTKHGIAADRIETHGYGASRPKVDGDDEASRAVNRRVELQKL